LIKLTFKVNTLLDLATFGNLLSLKPIGVDLGLFFLSLLWSQVCFLILIAEPLLHKLIVSVTLYLFCLHLLVLACLTVLFGVSFGVIILVVLKLLEFLGLPSGSKLFLRRSSFGVLQDQSLILCLPSAGEVDPSDSLTDLREKYLRKLCLHCQPEELLSKFVESIQLRICIWDIVESHLGLEISVLCLPKLLQSSSTYLEDVTAVHSKNCQVIVLTPEGLSNSITRADLKPTKRKHKNIPLQYFGGSLVVLPSESGLVFEEEKLSGLYQTVARRPCIH